ncbi:hypothetical protein BOTBODRAFT_401096 [Botryobasidium botryosum FD-172 SS1]|uniref:Uncharacterized protein n=1 Tax=Botryobasidium botryosum (strain FD-172 SS1) TaxID=930990 RepID=A0A067MB80_BOTB1|nr:hypothetical protein BOTBODRAFT_401096 [Botryobasidium botryosum FD-172 SS1]
MYYIASGAFLVIFLLLISIAHYCYPRDSVVHFLSGLFLVIVGLYPFPRPVLTAITDTRRGDRKHYSGPRPYVAFDLVSAALGVVCIVTQGDFYASLVIL